MNDIFVVWADALEVETTFFNVLLSADKCGNTSFNICNVPKNDGLSIFLKRPPV